MKKWILGICLFTVLLGFNAGAEKVLAEDSFINQTEAIRIGNGFVNDFNRIVQDGSIEQYLDTWAYDILVDWEKVLNEIGTFYGIKSSTATVDSEKANITVIVHGTKRYGVLEFVLHYEDVPQVNIYSKFSLAKWLDDTGIGAALILLNSVALLVLLIFVLRKQKALPVAERNQAIDDTIKHIIQNEEKAEDEEFAAIEKFIDSQENTDVAEEENSG